MEYRRFIELSLKATIVSGYARLPHWHGNRQRREKTELQMTVTAPTNSTAQSRGHYKLSLRKERQSGGKDGRAWLCVEGPQNKWGGLMDFVFAFNQILTTFANNVREIESYITECRNVSRQAHKRVQGPLTCAKVLMTDLCFPLNMSDCEQSCYGGGVKFQYTQNVKSKQAVREMTLFARSVFQSKSAQNLSEAPGEGEERVSKDKSEKTEMDGRNQKVRATLSRSDSLCLTLVAFSPVGAPSICLRPPARKVSARTHRVRLSARGCMPGQWQLRGAIYSRNHAGVQCVSACLCRMCFSVSKVINHRKIRAAATCDLAVMTHSCTQVQPGVKTWIKQNVTFG